MDALDGDPATTAGLSCVASHQGPVFTDGIEAGANLARCCTNARDIAARMQIAGFARVDASFLWRRIGAMCRECDFLLHIPAGCLSE